MSKTLKKKKHWLSKVQECAVSWAGPPGDLGAEIRGGAERGEFPYLGRLREEPGGGTCCVVSGKAPSPGDVLLEVNGTPVSGLTNRDTLAVIRHFREPIRLKTVKPGKPGGRPGRGGPSPPWPSGGISSAPGVRGSLGGVEGRRRRPRLPLRRSQH